MQKLKIKKIYKDSVLPTKGTEYSAGYDLYAYLDNTHKKKSGQRETVATGIAIALEDKNSVALVYARSGLGIKNGITLSNSVGVIDADYRGEIKVGLQNHSDKDYIINPGDRIAQMVITPIFTPELEICDELPSSERDTGGLGSTGR